MTRSQACRDQIQWIESNCPLDRTSIIPIKKANEFVEKHVEISTLSTDAIQPLTKINDERVQEKTIASLKTIIDSGKKPTKTIVKKVIADSWREVHNEPLIQKAMAITPEQWKETVKPIPENEINKLEIISHEKEIERIKGWIEKCESDIIEYKNSIKVHQRKIAFLQECNAVVYHL